MRKKIAKFLYVVCIVILLIDIVCSIVLLDLVQITRGVATLILAVILRMQYKLPVKEEE